jgi:methionine biosynthesis protein MetW
MTLLSRLIGLLQRWGDLDREYRRDVLSLFEPNSEATLLDVGCGDGQFTLKVAARIGTSKVFGIDVVKENVEQAKARGIACYQADLDEARFPFEDESFDAVCANQIIEHLSKTDAFVKEVYRVLRPGGYAVISTPNLAALQCLIFLLLGWQPLPAHVSDETTTVGSPVRRSDCQDQRMPGSHHRRVFTLRALEEFLKHHGFDVEGGVASGFFPLPASIARLVCAFDKRHATNLAVKAHKSYPNGATGT